MADLVGEDRPGIKDVVRNEKVLHTDPVELHKKALLNYRDWAGFQFPDGGTTTPYFHVVDEISKTDSPYQNLFASVMENWEKLAPVVFPMSVHEGIEVDPEEAKQSANFLLGGADYVSEQLEKGGIRAPVDLLVSSTVDPKLVEILNKYTGKGKRRVIDILEHAHEEYLKVLHATRIFDETRQVLGDIAPFIPWPKKQLLPFTTYRDIYAPWMINGFCGAIDAGKKHIVGIVEISDDSDNLRSEARQTELRVIGSFADKYVLAAHEAAGHASFNELYPDDVVDEVFGIDSNRDKDSIADILSEGYAIYIEEVAARLPGTVGPNREYLYDYGFEEIRKNRVEALGRILTIAPDKVKPVQKTYTNGASIVRTLLREHGLSHEKSEVQLAKLREILKDVDIKKASGIKMGSDEYFACLTKPTSNLPRGSHSQ